MSLEISMESIEERVEHAKNFRELCEKDLNEAFTALGVAAYHKHEEDVVDAVFCIGLITESLEQVKSEIAEMEAELDG